MKKIAVLVLCSILLICNISYGEYIDNDNGTITDSSTGLIWQKNSTYGSYSHDYANTYVDQLNTGGYSNWRLPTYAEISGIEEYVVNHPDFDRNETYWSNVIDTISGLSIGVSFIYYGASIEVLPVFTLSAKILAVRDPPWHSSDPNSFNSLIDTTWEFRYSDDNEYINTVFFDNNITESSTGNYLNLLGYGDIGQPGLTMFGDFLIGDEKGYICTLQTKISSIYEIYQFNIDGNTAIGNRHLTGDFGPGTINNIKGIKIEKTIEEHFNDAPSAPARNYPLNNDEVMSTEPALSISNSIDPEGNVLTYTFEIYADLGLTSLITSISDVQEGENTTSWQVDVTLNDNSFYYWRTRAYDGIEYSSWMPTALFIVKTASGEYTVNLEISLDVSASAQETQTVKVEDDASPIKGVSIEIPQEALEEDCTITIGVVTKPPALPSNTKAIGRVMEFGPEGITFLKPVSIMIPYTQSDLDNAGVTNPAQLEIFIYRVSTLSWEKIAIDNDSEWRKDKGKKSIILSRYKMKQKYIFRAIFYWLF